MVVGIHTTGGHCGFDSFYANINTIIRQVLNAGVPMFFAISGFFLSKKNLETKENRFKFWKHQIPKVYIPALIWGLPWLALALYGGGDLTLQVVLWLFCGLSIFYYIAVIIQYYLLLPVIQRFTPPLYRNLISIGLSFISIVFITWLRFIKGVELPLILYAGFSPLWIVFFTMGVSLAENKREYKLSWLVVLLVVSLALQYVESYCLNISGNSGFGIKPSSFLFSAILILVLFSSKVETKWKPIGIVAKIFTWLGELSFGIYLTHCLVILMVSKIPYNHLWILDWTLTLVLDVAFIIILKKIIPDKCYKYIGI